MTIRLVLGAACALAMALRALGDTPLEPTPWVAASANQEAFFKMVPGKYHFEKHRLITDREPFGVAYRLAPDGTFVALWRCKGWYAPSGALSDDSDYLVVTGPWASDVENHTDLAVAFYKRGKVIKSHQVKDLIKDPTKLEYSVSHYFWRPAKQTSPTGILAHDQDLFELVMIDKTDYLFYLKSGEIAGFRRDEGAMTRDEYAAEIHRDTEKRGTDLYEPSAFKRDFDSAFEVTDISASRGGPSGVDFYGESWSANLTPKKALSHPTRIEIALPILDGKVEVSVTSAQILGTFEKFLKHPYVQREYLAKGLLGIRMRITGHRLHWNTAELRGLLKKSTGKDYPDSDLASWAHFLIDRTGSIDEFDLSENGELLLFEDRSQKPLAPVMFDSKGERIPNSPK